jgi:hypothetical protein
VKNQSQSLKYLFLKVLFLQVISFIINLYFIYLYFSCLFGHQEVNISFHLYLYQFYTLKGFLCFIKENFFDCLEELQVLISDYKVIHFIDLNLIYPFLIFHILFYQS